jgi:hypothetical protein
MSETSNRSDSGSSLLGGLFRTLMSLFFIGVSVACVYNVFGVGGEVEALAKETACIGRPLPCTAQYTRAERTPWAHSFKMYTSPTSGETDIVCKREYILVGDYSCKPKDGSTANAQPVADPASSVKDGPASGTSARFPQKAKTPIPRPQPAPAVSQ